MVAVVLPGDGVWGLLGASEGERVMERIIIVNSTKRFDEVVHSCPSEGGDLEFVLKQGGTESGNACVAVTFTCEINNKLIRVQSVTTLRALIVTLKGLEAAEQGNRDRN